MTVTAEDATGQPLSLAQSIPVTIVAGSNNSIPLILGGIPHAIHITTETPATSSMDSTSGITLTPSTTAQLSVISTDADNNLIVGPGSPSLSGAITAATAGSGLAVSAPSSSSPNSFALSSTGSGAATLTFTATPLTGSPIALALAVSAPALASTTAGSTTSGFGDGTGSAASFSYPNGLAYDPTNGDLYIADLNNCAIRQLTSSGVVTTLAGGTPPTVSCGFVDGSSSAAKLYSPNGVAYDSSNGTLYVADRDNCAIRQITLSGTVTTIAGGTPTAATCGFADGTGAAARFSAPYAITYDSANGDLYVVDGNNCAIRQVTTSGVVTTIAGGSPPTATCGFADGSGASAKFDYAYGITYDATNGDLYVADGRNCAIRQLTIAGVVTTIAGALPPSPACGYLDGTGAAARLTIPNAITYDAANGNLYFTDSGNCAVRLLTTGGAVSTIGGSPPPTRLCGYANGSTSLFSDLLGIAVDSANASLYVSDNHSIRSLQI